MSIKSMGPQASESMMAHARVEVVRPLRVGGATIAPSSVTHTNKYRLDHGQVKVRIVPIGSTAGDRMPRPVRAGPIGTVKLGLAHAGRRRGKL